MTIEMIENQPTKIKVIGVGGGGGNAVEHMIQCDVGGVDFICANTDAQALANSSANTIIQLGESGLGAGSKPEIGRQAAEQAEAAIREAIAGTNMLFITAGMGGGTGTGAAPVIARIAKEMGILTVGVVTKPFGFEGGRRMRNADAGLQELEANVDSLIVVLNEQLIQTMDGDPTHDQALAQADDVLKNAVGGIAEIINVPGNINVDFEDVRSVMIEPGKAMMGTALASGPDRARIAAEQAMACPLLEGIDLKDAKGVLVFISATKSSLKLSESMVAMNTINTYASPDALVIYGTAYDDSLGDDIRVTVVATGLNRPAVQQVSTPMQVTRTKVDSMPLQVPTLNNAIANPLDKSSGNGGGNGKVVANNVLTQTDYGNLNNPAVWRNNRTQAAARVGALSNGGMDDFEIPAFLRKQAD